MNVHDDHSSLAEQIDLKDWSATPLGPIEQWPQSLRTSVSICVSSRFPMLVMWGRELVHIYNDAFRPILGGKHPDALGGNGSEVWSEIWSIIDPMLNGVLDGDEPIWSEDQMFPLVRYGFVEECYFTFSYSPINDESGAPGGVLVTCTETTSRVVGSRRLALLQELGLRTMLAATEEDVCVQAMAVLSERRDDIAFAEMYHFDVGGAPRNVATTQGTALIADGIDWPFEHARDCEYVIRDAASAHAPIVSGVWPEPVRTVVILPMRRTGASLPYGHLVIGLSPRRPYDDDAAGFVQLLADHLGAAVERARALRSEQQRAEALAEIDRAKTTFFSNVSHEFRTPLTLILGPIEEAMTSAGRNLAGDDLDVVHRNALRLLRLVNTLLDYSRVEAGRARAQTEPTELTMLTTDAASTFRSAMERAGLDYVVDCDDVGTVAVDREMWEQVVLNLVSNALKFTFEGSVRVSLGVERFNGDDAVSLRVSDTGVGIDPADCARIFDRFHRIDGRRGRTHEGTGIGLALVRELVELHGGAIDVQSELDRGTTFTVTMPRGATGAAAATSDEVVRRDSRRARAYVEEASRWIGNEASTTETSASNRIVVVDDNRDMREYIVRLLSKRWTVESYPDGAQALNAIRENPPQLVISDVMMPVLDGFELLDAIRSDEATASVPVLLLSARSGEESIAEGLRAGADDYLTKPFTASALIVRVEKRLAAARERAAARASSDAERLRLQSMFDHSPAAIAILRGPDMIVEFANPTFLELWGRDSEDIGQPLVDVLPEIRGQEAERILQSVRERGAPFRATSSLVQIDRRRTGVLEDVYFDLVYAPLYDQDGSVSSIFVHAFDVTELVDERRQAEAANRMKDLFLATVSHELKTPLTAILGWTTLLHNEAEDRELVARGLETIERNANAQARLIEDILDIARITSGKLHLELKPIAVSEFIGNALDAIRPLAANAQIELRSALPEDAGAVSGDAVRMQQIVLNLLNNAVKFTPRGGEITVSVRHESGDVVISVSDTGIGIPEDQLELIFERFRQVDSPDRRRHGGLGLGLALVRQLMELHGGTVGVESSLGIGTTFTLRLPALTRHEGAIVDDAAPGLHARA